jgi:hypothetical protein
MAVLAAPAMLHNAHCQSGPRIPIFRRRTLAMAVVSFLEQYLLSTIDTSVHLQYRPWNEL